MSRRAVVIQIAPVAPPCFHDRLAWVEFLVSAAEDTSRTGARRGPLDLRKTEPAFNYAFDFCEQCSANYALRMQGEDRCHPWHLRELAPKKEPSGA